MNRITALQEICSRYPYQKMAQSLSESEFDVMVQFIEDNNELNHLEFEYKVNRMFLQMPDINQKQIRKIMDLLVSANSRVHTKGK